MIRYMVVAVKNTFDGPTPQVIDYGIEDIKEAEAFRENLISTIGYDPENTKVVQYKE